MGLTWKVRQFTLLILQGGHVIARVLPLILGGGTGSSSGPVPLPSPNSECTGVCTSPTLPPGHQTGSVWPTEFTQCLLCAVGLRWAPGEERRSAPPLPKHATTAH